MVKKVKPSTKTKPVSKNKYFPFVSVCTPTFNRRPFILTMFECFRNQDYPKDRMEWIIVDDGTDKISDLIHSANIPQIKYFDISEKMTLGKKRNYMHERTKGSIIVYMDDDDYYPPERISHAVERLTQSPTALCAGSSEIYIYFKHLQKMYQCGPYGPNHSTAGTFAFKIELLQQTKYDDNASLAEEKLFLKNYTIPFVQLDPLKTILVFSHQHNTYDKRKMLENPHPTYFKESDKTVETFIRKSSEMNIKNFFMNIIDNLLIDYKPGEPNMKPDVLKQLKEMDIERQNIISQQPNQNTPIIMMNQNDGKPPVPISIPDILNIVSNQQEHIKSLLKQNKELHDTIQLLQLNNSSVNVFSKVITKSNNKTEPEIVL